jgi:hypothetical protein
VEGADFPTVFSCWRAESQDHRVRRSARSAHGSTGLSKNGLCGVRFVGQLSHAGAKSSASSLKTVESDSLVMWGNIKHLICIARALPEVVYHDFVKASSRIRLRRPTIHAARPGSRLSITGAKSVPASSATTSVTRVIMMRLRQSADESPGCGRGDSRS